MDWRQRLPRLPQWLMNLLGRLEGLLLVLLGLALLQLAGGGDYAQLFNPKLAWLTRASGGIAMLLGAGLAIAPAAPVASRTATLLLLLALLGSYQPPPAAIPPGGLTGQGPGEDAGPPRETFQGTEYTRINTAELFFLARQADQHKLLLPYATRGVVRRSPEMDARGEIALVRVAVTCCLADAVALGVRVKVDDPGKYLDESWIKVYGTLEHVDAPPPAGMTAQGIFPVALERDYRLLAQRVVQETAGLPFIFEIRPDEPYAY